ncbi:MAG: anaerobic selenocysteine-containing dehydrogenase [Candidatus Azotimanducaceae bacterium]|jgi:anaerobic selenocysteine-containing dehydrogenase
MHHRICPVCEAGCGLHIAVDGRTVTAISANSGDLFSKGHICAKGLSLAQLDADPDRLKTAFIRKDGELVPASTDEALEVILSRLNAIRDLHGPNSIGTYLGNPTAHNIGLSLGLGPFLSALGSVNIFSAGSVDQIPKQLANALMFGDSDALPVPDIERADFLLMLGANPVVSNGSLWMVPGFRDKLRDFKSRGGKFVTIDPRRSETARLADVHHGIVPGTDAFLLAALINEMQRLGATMPNKYPHNGWDVLREEISRLSLEEAAGQTGISGDSIQSLAQMFMDADRPVAYGRVGTTLQPHGTLTSFLVEVVNLLIGSLDAQGGAMFPEQPYADPSRRRPATEFGRYQSRVSGRPEVLGQMPVSVLAEEIEQQGEGQIKALVCVAGNPVISNPDSERLEAAFESLEFMVCVDIYHNETTRLADVILPGTSPFEEGHYDKFLGSMGYRNVARYSPPVFETEQYREWDVGLALTCLIKNRRVPDQTDLRACEDDVIAAAISRYTTDPKSPLFERDVQELLALIEPELGVERLLDLGIRAGRFGDHFGLKEGITLNKLIENPDGIDFGAPRAGRINEIIKTASGRLELAPEILIKDLRKLLLKEAVHDVDGSTLRLVGRRGTRTNNSWLGNLPMLSKGGRQCTLEVNPVDADELGLVSGDAAVLSSAQGRVEVEVSVTENIAAGVVSLPHGFSEATNIRQQKLQKGGNYNQLIPAAIVDEPSGTSALNGFAVSILKI